MNTLPLFTIRYQQMHFNITYNVRILYGTLLHVSAPWCHPQGALRSSLKLHTIIILQNVMVEIKSWLKLIKLIKTARVVRGGCICNGCDVAAVLVRCGHWQQHHNRCIYSHHQQLLLFLSVLLVCNFIKERRTPWGWHHGAETCRSVPYNIRTV